MDGVWFAVALGQDEKILACSFSTLGRGEGVASILGTLPASVAFSEKKPNALARDVLTTMHSIYEGKGDKRDFKLDMDRLPRFMKNVLLVTLNVPRGFVTTYGEIGEALGNKRAARAVGQAEASNPFGLLVPCHRVIGSNLGLHGYSQGFDVKRAILEREGVTFLGRHVAREHLWIPRVKR